MLHFVLDILLFSLEQMSASKNTFTFNKKVKDTAKKNWVFNLDMRQKNEIDHQTCMKTICQSTYGLIDLWMPYQE